MELREVGAGLMPRVAVLGLALLLVGCSGSHSSSDPTTRPATATSNAVTSPTKPIDPCTLFTASDASRLAGKSLTRAPGGGLGSSTCAYSGGKVLIGAELVVKVDASAAAAHAEFAKWVLPVPNTAPGFAVTPVANVGDEAKTTHSSFTDGIYFRAGAVLVKIGVYPPVTDEALTTAADTARDRL